MVHGIKYVAVVLALVSHCNCADIGSICQTLWNADTNSLHYGKDYQLDVQSQLSYNNNYDMSRRKLFSSVNETKLNGPTWTAFQALLDNYDVDIGYTEVLTMHEKKENDEFLTAIMATSTMKKLHSYLCDKGLAPLSESSFKNELKKMWLYFYRRDVYRDSSGFEHVFLGELKHKKGQTQVTGFHSWLQFYLEEKYRSLANYYGYFTFQKNVEPVSLKFQMSWHNYLKPVTSFFVGTSPEIELALYTACFKEYPNQLCECNINGQKVAIQTYDMASIYVGTAYPVA